MPASLGDVVAADYAVGHLDADLHWLETTLAGLAELHAESVDSHERFVG